MEKRYTRVELEALLEQHYIKKLCHFKYPGQETVTGIVSKLAVDRDGTVIVGINNIRYTVSLESVKECLQVINHGPES